MGSYYLKQTNKQITNLQQIQEGHVSSTPQLLILRRNFNALALFPPVPFLSDR